MKRKAEIMVEGMNIPIVMAVILDIKRNLMPR